MSSNLHNESTNSNIQSKHQKSPEQLGSEEGLDSQNFIDLPKRSHLTNFNDTINSKDQISSTRHILEKDHSTNEATRFDQNHISSFKSPIHRLPDSDEMAISNSADTSFQGRISSYNKTPPAHRIASEIEFEKRLENPGRPTPRDFELFGSDISQPSFVNEAPINLETLMEQHPSYFNRIGEQSGHIYDNFDQKAEIIDERDSSNNSDSIHAEVNEILQKFSNDNKENSIEIEQTVLDQNRNDNLNNDQLSQSQNFDDLSLATFNNFTVDKFEIPNDVTNDNLNDTQLYNQDNESQIHDKNTETLFSPKNNHTIQSSDIHQNVQKIDKISETSDMIIDTTSYSINFQQVTNQASSINFENSQNNDLFRSPQALPNYENTDESDSTLNPNDLIDNKNEPQYHMAFDSNLNGEKRLSVPMDLTFNDSFYKEARPSTSHHQFDSNQFEELNRRDSVPMDITGNSSFFQDPQKRMSYISSQELISLESNRRVSIPMELTHGSSFYQQGNSQKSYESSMSISNTIFDQSQTLFPSGSNQTNDSPIKPSNGDDDTTIFGQPRPNSRISIAFNQSQPFAHAYPDNATAQSFYNTTNNDLPDVNHEENHDDTDQGISMELTNNSSKAFVNDTQHSNSEMSLSVAIFESDSQIIMNESENQEDSITASSTLPTTSPNMASTYYIDPTDSNHRISFGMSNPIKHDISIGDTALPKGVSRLGFDFGANTDNLEPKTAPINQNDHLSIDPELQENFISPLRDSNSNTDANNTLKSPNGLDLSLKSYHMDSPSASRLGTENSASTKSTPSHSNNPILPANSNLDDLDSMSQDSSFSSMLQYTAEGQLNGRVSEDFLLDGESSVKELDQFLDIDFMPKLSLDEFIQSMGIDFKENIKPDEIEVTDSIVPQNPTTTLAQYILSTLNTSEIQFYESMCQNLKEGIANASSLSQVFENGVKSTGSTIIQDYIDMPEKDRPQLEKRVRANYQKIENNKELELIKLMEDGLKHHESKLLSLIPHLDKDIRNYEDFSFLISQKLENIKPHFEELIRFHDEETNKYFDDVKVYQMKIEEIKKFNENLDSELSNLSTRKHEVSESIEALKNETLSIEEYEQKLQKEIAEMDNTHPFPHIFNSDEYLSLKAKFKDLISDTLIEPAEITQQSLTFLLDNQVEISIDNPSNGKLNFDTLKLHLIEYETEEEEHILNHFISRIESYVKNHQSDMKLKETLNFIAGLWRKFHQILKTISSPKLNPVVELEFYPLSYYSTPNTTPIYFLQFSILLSHYEKIQQPKKILITSKLTVDNILNFPNSPCKIKAAKISGEIKNHLLEQLVIDLHNIPNINLLEIISKGDSLLSNQNIYSPNRKSIIDPPPLEGDVKLLNQDTNINMKDLESNSFLYNVKRRRLSRR